MGRSSSKKREETELQQRLERIIAEELEWLQRAAHAAENGGTPKR